MDGAFPIEAERADADGGGHAVRAVNERIDTLIVGAGFSGLALALEMAAAGRSFTMIEKADTVGGTWAANRYPGAACDVPSHLYQLERRPHADWSRTFAPRGEIHDYLRSVAADPSIHERLRLGTQMKDAAWEQAAKGWRVRLRCDDRETDALVTHLVLATGMLHVPKRPVIDGLDRFTGTVRHTAEWDAELSVRDRDVAVIGTGASAIQLVPALVERGARVALYQRSAPHVVAKGDRAIDPKRGAMRWRGGRAVYRRWLFEFHEMRHMVWRGYHRAVDSAEAMSRRARENAVKDEALRAALEPNHRIGCKRILQSNDYYGAIAGDAVELVTDPIERITQTGIVAGGRERHAEVIALATGFHSADAAGLDVRGRTQTLREAWSEGATALGGMHVAGFPNMSVLLGPGTALGHNSMVLMAEAQSTALMRHLKRMERAGTAVWEPRADAVEAWEAKRAEAASRTVWGLAPGMGGCGSWYHDAAGRPSAVWPGTVRQFRRALRRIGGDAFHDR